LAESLLQPAWVDSQGRREGRYVIGPLLGQGSMGHVYEAWDTVLARPVALKVLQHLDPAAMVRFMHEAQLHARVDSPNICRIYDVDASNGSLRIAMQLVRGPTLEDLAAELTLDEILNLLAQVADAVHGAHRLNLIHRDLKPSNILLQPAEQGGWIPFICDFGLAMALDGPSVTQPLAMTGTPAYMAPEQVRGDRSLVGPATDVYGIGSTLYFTLLGRPPCVSTSTGEMLRVKRGRAFPSPRSLEPNLPPALEAVLLKCLEPAPRDRYPSAAVLAEELRRVRTGLAGPEPGGIRHPAPAEPAAVSWLRRRWSLLAGLGLLVGVAGSLPMLARSLQRHQRRQDETAQIIALEGAALEQGIRNERLQPLHDLRPAETRTRERMHKLLARMAIQGTAAQGATGVALGRASLLLEDLPAARTQLEAAWAHGTRTADAALLLAQVQIAHCLDAQSEAAFQGRPDPPAAAAAMAQADRYLGLAQMQTSQPKEYAEALAALLHGDHPHAAQSAQAALETSPWHLESAVLAATSLAQLARERMDAGDAGGAEARYQEALDLARGALTRGPSTPRLYHACAVAGLGLAAAALERGSLRPEALEELERWTDQQLLLDPGRPEAQSDWLQVRSLKAMGLLGRGQDPQPVLDRAQHFLWTRTREPRGPELRADHMVLYWLQAERDAARHEDPAPALTEALKEAGHTPDRFRDFLGDLLLFQASDQASRGQDPRPAVAALQARFAPAGPQSPQLPWRNGELLAKAWLVRARWEGRQKIDPTDSILQAQTLLQRTLRDNPGSAAGHALLGQCQVLEAHARPENRDWLLARATEHLRWSRRLNRLDPDQAHLQQLLAAAP
jgi:serine/threonine-protein kinase